MDHIPKSIGANHESIKIQTKILEITRTRRKGTRGVVTEGEGPDAEAGAEIEGDGAHGCALAPSPRRRRRPGRRRHCGSLVVLELLHRDLPSRFSSPSSSSAFRFLVPPLFLSSDLFFLGAFVFFLRS